MKNNGYSFCIFVLIIIFTDELFFGFQILSNGVTVSGMKQVEVAVIAFFSYAIILIDLLSGNTSKREWKTLIIHSVIIGLYSLTQLYYPNAPILYFTYLLLLASQCLAASYVGSRLAHSTSLQQLNIILPIFVIPLSLIIGILGYRYIHLNMLLTGDDSGINYQSLSYYMAYFYSYAAYYIFLVQKSKSLTGMLFRWIMFPLMIFCFIISIASGGRGAFIYLLIASGVILWYSFTRNRKQFFYLSLIFIPLLLLSISWTGLSDTVGWIRISNDLFEDEIRLQLREKAMNSFFDAPFLGHGLGSIWWEVGFYSHFVITDLLVETGIIGTLLWGIVLAIIVHKLIKMARWDNTFILIMLIFIGTLVQLLFSGYWLASFKFFFTTAFILSYKYNNTKFVSSN